MPIKSTCHECGREFRLSDDIAGRRFRCGDCGATVVAGPSSATTPKSRAAKPATRRRRPAEEEYEEYDPADEYEDFESYADDYDPAPRRHGRRPAELRRRLGVGLMVVATAAMVRSVGYLCTVLSFLIGWGADASSAIRLAGDLNQGEIWLHFISLLAFCGGYVCCSMGPERGSSRTISIGAAMAALFGAGLWLFLPTVVQASRGRRVASGISFQAHFTGSVWEVFAKQIFLTALFLAHAAIFIFFVKAMVDRRSELIADCRRALVALGAFFGLYFLHAIYLVVLVRYILPWAAESAREEQQEARRQFVRNSRFGDMATREQIPGAFWIGASNFLQLFVLAAFMAFLFLFVRLTLRARRELA